MNECIQRFLIIINYYKINIHEITNKIINNINRNKDEKSYILKYLYEIYRNNILQCKQVNMLHQYIGIYHLCSNSYIYYKVENDIYCEFTCTIIIIFIYYYFLF